MTTSAPSFRDPEGRLFFSGPKVFRALSPAGQSSLHRILECPGAKPHWMSGSIVPTRLLDPAETSALLADPAVANATEGLSCSGIAEHEPAPFPNYPHEWPPEMLHAAGALTLELARSLLPHGIGLKDATPSNVMFWGTRPVFLDVLSFEERNAYDPTWLPYAQLVRTFLLPLFVNRRFGTPLSQIFTTRRDGLEPEEVYPLLSALQKLSPSSLSLVSFPVWFGKRVVDDQKIYQPRRLKNAEQAEFIVSSLLRRQQRALDRLRSPEDRRSTWSDYTTGNNNYSATQADAKVDVVRQMLAEIRPSDALDIGCNTGVFSLLAAEAGARVVSVDFDPVVVGRLWRTAREKKASILPLVVNIARPTPALGWMNRESRSFVDRATQAFDVVLMLALLHHLIVTERVPLHEVFQIARRFTRRWLIVEYVGPSDSMFMRLTRGRAHLHEGFGQEAFETAARNYFRIVRSEQVPGADRRLYLLEATGAL